MNLSEVIGKDKQRDGRFQVVPFTATTIRQTGETAHPYPDGQIKALNVRRANEIGIGVAEPRLYDGAFQFPRRVPRWAFRHASVNLDQLCEVNSGSEGQTHSVRISGHAVGGKLK